MAWWKGKKQKRYWDNFCTLKNKKGVKVLLSKTEVPPRGKKVWHVEVFEDMEGNRGLLINQPDSGYCFIIPTAIPKKTKENFVLDNEALPKYVKEYLEKNYFKYL